MPRYIVAFLLIISCVNLSQADTSGVVPASARSEPSRPGPDYVLGSGDVLEVTVWKEEGLTKDVLVRPDGGISFPLVGDLNAGGKTIAQLTSDIVKGLGSYLSEPSVNVAIKVANQRIYVVGKVNKPGEYPTTQQVDVMQALAMAGGLSPFADNDDIKILRRENGRLITFSFDYDDVSNGDGLEQNILLKRGDVVVVP